MIRMIVAADRGNSIGWQDGRLPWKLPADMKRFKELTSDSPVVMGWNTFVSLNRPDGLPNRRNIVLTRKPFEESKHLHGTKIDIWPTFDVLTESQKGLGISSFRDYWLIGGAKIYEQAINAKCVDEIYLTAVDDNSEADVKLSFDLINWKHFILQQQKIGVQWILEYISDLNTSPDGINFTFITLRKIK